MNLNGASTVIVNVSGSSIDFSANEIDSLATSTNVIWNFYQATSVSLGTAINGTVPATLANVTNQNQIDGGLFAQSWGWQRRTARLWFYRNPAGHHHHGRDTGTGFDDPARRRPRRPGFHPPPQGAQGRVSSPRFL